MKNRTTTKEKLSFLTQWSFVSLFLFPVLPPKVANVLFIVFGMLVAVSCFYNKPRFMWENIRHNALIGIPFIPYLAEYLTHYNSRVAGFELEKKILFFAAPLLLSVYLSIYQLKSLRVYMRVFIAALVGLTLYSITVLACQNLLFSQYGFDNGARMLRNCFEFASNLYPTYFGLFATVAIVWMVYDYKNQSFKGKAIYVSACSIILFQQLLLAAKMPLIALIISWVYIVYKTTTDKRKLWLKYALMAGFFTVIGFTFPSVKNRVMDAESMFVPDNTKTAVIVSRVDIFGCDKEIFINNFWLGIGSRNAQAELNNCYRDKGYGRAIPYLFNEHNQFLTLGINYGVFIMMIFITGMIYFIVKNRKNPFALVFMLSAMLVMLTESILERQCGVYFYVLFFLILFNSTPREVE